MVEQLKTFEIIRGSAKREVTELEKKVKALESKLSDYSASPKINHGLQNTTGNLIPLTYLIKTNSEDGTSISEADLSSIFGGQCSIQVIVSVDKVVQETKVNISEECQLKEIDDHLKMLATGNKPQNLFFDIVMFHDLCKDREKILHPLQDSPLSGMVVSSASKSAGYTVEAFNPNSKEKYFKLVWFLTHSVPLNTLCNNFQFSSTPQEISSNAKLIFMVSKLRETCFWIKNRRDLLDIWTSIVDWIGNQSGRIKSHDREV